MVINSSWKGKPQRDLTRKKNNSWELEIRLGTIRTPRITAAVKEDNVASKLKLQNKLSTQFIENLFSTLQCQPACQKSCTTENNQHLTLAFTVLVISIHFLPIVLLDYHRGLHSQLQYSDNITFFLSPGGQPRKTRKGSHNLRVSSSQTSAECLLDTTSTSKANES